VQLFHSKQQHHQQHLVRLFFLLQQTMSYTNQDDVLRALHTPLLGVLPKEVETDEEENEELDVNCNVIELAINLEEDEEEGVAFKCTIGLVVTSDDNKSAMTQTWFDLVVALILLPVLLLLQFGIAFSVSSGQEANLHGLSWSVVRMTVAGYVVTSVLYRQACQERKVRSAWVWYLPEILMDVILGLILFHHILTAFYVLFVSMASLASYVVVVYSVKLLTVVKTCPLPLEQDELDESYSRGKLRQDSIV
jgi:septum formation topological specificity factor MinE